MKKKVVMATLCITLSAMAPSGCGGSEDETETEVVTEVQTETTDETEEVTEEETEETETEDTAEEASPADATSADATPSDAESPEATLADATSSEAETESTDATPSDAKSPEATLADATPSEVETESTETTPSDAVEADATSADATPSDATEADATPAEAVPSEPVEYTSPDGAFHLTLPDDSWEEAIVEEGVQMYLYSGDESAIFILHGLQAGLGEAMMLDENPDTKEEYIEQIEENITQSEYDVDIEVLEYTKEINEDKEFVCAYAKYSSDTEPTFYTIEYITASENEGYVLSAVSYADRVKADQVYEAVMSFDFEIQELPATPADATEAEATVADATEAEIETEEETEEMTEEETEEETEEMTEEETEEETEEMTEEETEEETEEMTEEETEATETVVYEAEDGSFTMTLPDDSWEDETAEDRVVFTSGDNTLTVEEMNLRTAQREMDAYPETQEEFEDTTGWDVVRYQNESIGDWELISVCWTEGAREDYNIVYYLKNSEVAYVLNGTTDNETDAEAIYRAALSFKNLER